jgi:DNA-binding transcriptional regulator YiaG
MRKNDFPVRDMRSRLAMTQEEFAQELGITVSTVNRWENGHSQPSKLARATLGRMASRHGVFTEAAPIHKFSDPE